MKVLHLSASGGGGAGVAARRSVAGLRHAGIDAELWANDAVGGARRVRSQRWATWRFKLSHLPLKPYRRRNFFSWWSNDWVPSRMSAKVRDARPDLVHLHWLGDAFLGLSELRKFGAPVVWTLHDTWPFTGGCHYPADCTRYRDGCGSCPQLGSDSEFDLSSANLRRKRRALDCVSRWIAPSAWMGELAQTSPALFHAEVCVVPNGVDGNIFAPGAGEGVRERLGIPTENLVLIAGAVDLKEPRKGVRLLAESVGLFQRSSWKPCTVLLFGRNETILGSVPGINTVSLGSLSTESQVAQVLAAADLLLLPSLQDNLPNIAVEAQASGCPVVGFDAGGLQEIVQDGRTGGITTNRTAAGLAEALQKWFLVSGPRDDVAKRCRAHFETRFTLERHTTLLRSVYAEVLARSR